MKTLLTLSLILLATIAEAGTTATARGGYPILTISGVDHVIVSRNRATGESYDSATGFCKLLGYRYAASAVSQRCEEGPYAVLDQDGNLLATFPKDENLACELSTVIDLDCK